MWTDEQILTVLDLKDNEGWTLEQIGQRYGKTRSAIAGLINRVRADEEKHDQEGIQNGTMPRKWWKR